MSTGLNCEFFEPTPGEWFYALEDWSAPKSAWDWRDFSTCYGPFPSEGDAHRHLRANHANPGGWSITPNEHFRDDAKVYERLVLQARADRRWGR
jgi:hypothetical protein